LQLINASSAVIQTISAIDRDFIRRNAVIRAARRLRRHRRHRPGTVRTAGRRRLAATAPGATQRPDQA
jgi:hypothetical protein